MRLVEWVVSQEHVALATCTKTIAQSHPGRQDCPHWKSSSVLRRTATLSPLRTLVSITPWPLWAGCEISLHSTRGSLCRTRQTPMKPAPSPRPVAFIGARLSDRRQASGSMRTEQVRGTNVLKTLSRRLIGRLAPWPAGAKGDAVEAQRSRLEA
jgi:hypothetical protein